MATIRVYRQFVEALVDNEPTIEVYRQRLEALVTDDSAIRVSRQHVEVLAHYPIIDKFVTSILSLGQTTNAGPILRDGASTLALTSNVTYVGPKPVSTESHITLLQTANVPVITEVAPTSIIALNDQAIAGGSIRVSATSVIVFQQFADDITKLRHPDSPLDLTQVVDVDRITSVSNFIDLDQIARASVSVRNVVSTIDLQQSVRFEPFQQNAFNDIELSQLVRSNLHGGTSISTIDLSQSVEVSKPIYVSAKSEIVYVESIWDDDLYSFVDIDAGLRQSIALQIIGIHDYGSILGVKQGVSYYLVKATAIAASASSVLTLTQDAHISFAENVVSQLNLSQSTVGVVHDPTYSLIEIAQTVTYTAIRATRPTASTLVLKQAATYTLIIASTKSQYSPFIGSSTDPNAPTPPSTTVDGPMVGIQVPFQLVYPSVGSVTDAVSLKTPNLGNKDRLSFNRILRETRGGTMIVFADPIWPKIQSLVLSFSGLLNVEAQELLTFMDNHLGQEIGLIDWEHRYWRGIIITPDEPIVEDQFDSFTATFEFEGELDPDWNPQVVPPTLRYSATRTPQEEGYYVPNEPILPAVETYYYSAEADSPTKIGYPLYLTGSGHVDLAQADAAGTIQVVGLALEVVSAGFACDYISEGSIERIDWTEVAGTVNLLAGATYFLDPSIAGRITATAPTTASQYVVRVGRAVNTTTLDIEIELPIRL